MIGSKVNLRADGNLSRYFRDEVLNSVEVRYTVRWHKQIKAYSVR